MTTAMASRWFFMGLVMTLLSSLYHCLQKASSQPTFSQRPLAMTLSSAMLMTWYFREELPALITSTFMLSLSG